MSVTELPPKYLKLDYSQGRTIVVGDIHGCFDEMMGLLDICKFSDKDILISVGDMIDRGPKSWEVASFFREKKNAFSVLGNHERKISRVIKGITQPAWSQLHALSELTVKEKNNWANWFDTLPAVIETDKVIVTHARLDPEKKITDQDPFYTCAVGGERVKIDLDQDNVPVWYYEFVEKHNITKPICFGHISYKRVELIERKLYGLDTKAVKGDFLTALIFPEYKVMSLKVKENYYDQSYKSWINHILSNLDVSSVQLYQINDLQNKKLQSETDRIFIDRFEKKFQQYHITKRTELLKKYLPQVLGAIPQNGKERGEYFIKMNERFENLDQRRLIKKILTVNKIDLNLFFILFPKSTILGIDNLLSELEKKYNVNF